MQRLRQLLKVQYDYQLPQARQQARIITSLNPATLLMAAGLVLLGLMLFNSRYETTILFSSAGLLVALVIGSTLLLQRGRAVAASRYYVTLAVAISLWVLYLDGLPSQTILVLALPIILAGILLDRQHTRWTAAALVIGLQAIALIQGSGWEANRSPWIAFLPAILMVLFLGALQQLVNREVDGNLHLLTETRINESVTLMLGEQLAPATTLDDFMRRFGLALHDTYGLQQVQVFLRDPSNPNLIRQHLGIGVAAQRAQAAGRQILITDDNVIAATIRQKETLVVTTASLAMFQDELMPGSRSQVLLPIMVDGAAIGVLDLQSPHVDDFGEEQVRFLSAIANAVGAMAQDLLTKTQLAELSDEQSRLYAHLERNATETQRLRRQVAGVIWGRFFQDRGQDILGFDLEAQTAQPTATSVLSETMESSLTDGAVDVHRTEGGYLLTIPIKQRGEVLGVMEFELAGVNDVPPHVIDLATIVAERLSLALDNARLVEQTQATAFRERQVGDITRRLQSADNLETLVNTAATEFNTALGGIQTHIRLQLTDNAPDQASHNGGGAS